MLILCFPVIMSSKSVYFDPRQLFLRLKLVLALSWETLPSSVCEGPEAATMFKSQFSGVICQLMMRGPLALPCIQLR